jgi:hypothetical protein
MEEKQRRAEHQLLESDHESWEDIFEQVIRTPADLGECHTSRGYDTLRNVNHSLAEHTCSIREAAYHR